MSQDAHHTQGRGGLFSRGGGRRGGILGSTVRKVAGGIGLASESISAYKDNKKAQKQAAPNEQAHESQPTPTSFTNNNQTAAGNVEQEQQDDLTAMQWEIDEAQDDSLDNSDNMSLGSNAPMTDEEIAQYFIQGHAFFDNSNNQATAQLEMPVILAQRRPKDRTRGFVRGYAPMLADVGIDQKTWLDFLDSFDQSTRASPWIKAINLANIPTLLIPFGVGVAVGVAIDMTVKIAQNTQTKQRTNKFLDKINKDFFSPRGLFCLVMTWKPDSGKPHEVVSLTSTVASSMDSYSSGTANKFKASSGKTYGDFALPEAAPLIFPLVNAGSEEGQSFKQSMGKKKDFIDNYYDKRAQSEFAHANPNNTLNQQDKPQYSSRYADPNHASNSGSLLSLVTGGTVNPPDLRQGLGGRGRGGSRGGLGGTGGRGGEAGVGRGSSRLPIKPISAARNFLLKEDVLYLMVVNMPTEAELAEARNILA